MRVQEVITKIVEAMLPRFSDKNTALQMSLDLHVRKPGIDDESERLLIHLMFHRPNNFTKALWLAQTLDEYVDGGQKLPACWNLEADHDSEWVSEITGRLNELVRELTRKIDPEARYPDFEISVSFQIGRYPVLRQLKNWRCDSEKRTFEVEY